MHEQEDVYTATGLFSFACRKFCYKSIDRDRHIILTVIFITLGPEKNKRGAGVPYQEKPMLQVEGQINFSVMMFDGHKA